MTCGPLPDGPAHATYTLPSGANWIIDTGTSYPGGPANWGTGEIQVYTNQTRNLSLDGSGNLRITPIRDGSTWTSVPDSTNGTSLSDIQFLDANVGFAVGYAGSIIRTTAAPFS